MDESSQSKVTRQISKRNGNGQETRLGLFHDKGIDFTRESEMSCTNSNRIGNPIASQQELTLSYLCDTSKQAFLEKDFSSSGKIPSYKGKEVAVAVAVESSSPGDGEKWIERDFLNLNSSPSAKREIEDDEEEAEAAKRPKLVEALNLSLALPEVSLSLTASNAHHHRPNNNANTINGVAKPSRSVQSLTYNSNDYTAASLSYSYSHQVSHNPSCSLTRNSTENFDDPIWNCGEGTNGSVHSRFKPVGDGAVGLYSLMQQQGNNTANKKDTENSLSFFPSDLPARPIANNVSVTQSGDSRGKTGFEEFPRRASKPERLVREIVSESVPSMAQTIQELSEETLVITKEYLRGLITGKKDELVNLQSRLNRRSDLTKETLSKSHKDQLEILVAVKMGNLSYLASKNRLPASELVEIFLYKRCRNVNCKSLLPVDDCDCKICSGNRGFCNSCMCPMCLNFDCASNTCSWVGCDVCSHWCHASCGIQNNLIKPGPSLKGPSGTNEMQFHCIGCGHASEMFGFVKDVFLSCAKDWALETLVQELDCVRRIFRGSDDFKGKELQSKASDLIAKLRSKSMAPKDACSFITQFFNYAETMSEFQPVNQPSKSAITPTQPTLRKDTTPNSQNAPLPAKYAPYNAGPALNHRDMLPQLSKPTDAYESLESIVRIKEAEARMFQNKADEARKEAEEYHRVIATTTEKLETDFAERISKVRVSEAEERRRKKLDELKVLETSHCDYYNMKIRMQGEIAGLLERMEATKKQWV